MKPKKISVRPGNELEGGGIVVWVYGRKVQIQEQYSLDLWTTTEAIADAVDSWQYAMGEVQ